MIIVSKQIRDLFDRAGYMDIYLQLVNMKISDIDFIDITYNSKNKAEISYITADRFKRFAKDTDREWIDQGSDEVFLQTYMASSVDTMNDMFYEDDVKKKYFTKTKIGRFLRKFFSEDVVTTPMIEKLVALANEGLYEFQVVYGDQITYFYDFDNYRHGDAGELGNSCMSDEDCQEYFGIYEENAALLVLHAKDDYDTIVGRALLWNDVSYSIKNRKIKVMDRIYTCSTELDSLFREWAVENGYFYKTVARGLEVTNGVETLDLENNATIDIEGTYFGYYPYVDTFAIFKMDKDTGAIQLMAGDDSDMYPTLHCSGGNGDVEDSDKRVCSSCGKHSGLYRAYGYDGNNTSYDKDILLCIDCANKFTLRVRHEGLFDKYQVSSYVYEDLYEKYREESPTYVFKKSSSRIEIKIEGENVVGFTSNYSTPNKDYPEERQQVFRWNEEKGLYEHYSVRPCPVCGKYHDNFDTVAFYNAKADDEDITYYTVYVCADCIKEKVESGKFVDIRLAGTYGGKYNFIRYRSLGNTPNYVDVDSSTIKCDCCDEDIYVVDRYYENDNRVSGIDLYFGMITNSIARMCPTCAEVAIRDYYHKKTGRTLMS